jgi:hypothetical protein
VKGGNAVKTLLALIAAMAMVVAFGQWAIAGEELDEGQKEAAFIPPPPDFETQSMVTTYVPEENQAHNSEAR